LIREVRWGSGRIFIQNLPSPLLGKEGNGKMKALRIQFVIIGGNKT
jgi:hypothetical protein